MTYYAEDEENGIVGLFCHKFSTIIDFPTPPVADAREAKKWCAKRFGPCAAAIHISSHGHRQTYAFMHRHGKWDYAYVRNTLLFGFADSISDSDLIEFKLRFG